MQETRNKRKFFLLMILTLVTLAVFWWTQPENRLGIDQEIFKVEDLDAVSRVVLASPEGEVELAFDGGRWTVNDQFQADGDMIRVLFATLQQAAPKRQVAQSRQDSLFRALQASGVEVSLYADEGLRKKFVAGGNPQKTQAYFADPESGEVYVMTIPGYRVYVSGILELPVGGWRDKFVFNFNWRNFKSLRAEFPDAPTQNFTVSMSRDRFGIEGMAEADTAKLNNFLDAVSLLTVEEYIPEPKLTDSLLQRDPEMRIIVSAVGDRTFRLELYAGGRLGVIQRKDAALFDPKKIAYLLRPKSFFAKK